jgi:5-oxopent-3-ene-1,2,5-tricarboxylate decarboxylase/2-hydroxyhepta-2,4-diene-1,7-dioate isomerase
VAGCVLLNDLSLPHASYYRPAIRFRNRDGFLVCGAQAVPAAAVDLGALKIEALVNGAPAQTFDLASLVRDAAALLADVSAFMTLQPGDVLMLGTDCLADGSRPLVGPGDHVELRAAGLAPLRHSVVEDAP